MTDLLTPDFVYKDERGMICQLVSAGWNQVNVIVTKAGMQRGRMHYHIKNVEAFYIVKGKISYRCMSISTGKMEQHLFTAGDFWSVQPLVGHDFYFEEDTIHISMYDLGVDLPDGSRDIVELENCSQGH